MPLPKQEPEHKTLAKIAAGHERNKNFGLAVKFWQRAIKRCSNVETIMWYNTRLNYCNRWGGGRD